MLLTIARLRQSKLYDVRREHLLDHLIEVATDLADHFGAARRRASRFRHLDQVAQPTRFKRTKADAGQTDARVTRLFSHLLVAVLGSRRVDSV